jgi:hypothetical protein
VNQITEEVRKLGPTKIKPAHKKSFSVA